MPLSSYAWQTGLEWCTLPLEEQEVYEKQAEEVKLEHAHIYPLYKHKPRKGSTKCVARGTWAPKQAQKSTTSPSKSPSLSLSTPPVEAIVHLVQHTSPGNLSENSGFNGNGPTNDQPMVGPSANLFSPMSQVEQIWHHRITEPLVLYQSSASSCSQSSHSSCSQSPLSSFSQSPFSSSSQSSLTSPSPSFMSKMGISSFHHSPLPSSN